jgi:hypothetical protein
LTANGTGNISANHGHALTVPAADVVAGTAKSYDIQGSSGHAHQVDIADSDFAQLALGNSVTVVSSTGSGHTHTVTVNCA